MGGAFAGQSRWRRRRRAHAAGAEKAPHFCSHSLLSPSCLSRACLGKSSCFMKRTDENSNKRTISFPCSGQAGAQRRGVRQRARCELVPARGAALTHAAVRNPRQDKPTVSIGRAEGCPPICDLFSPPGSSTPTVTLFPFAPCLPLSLCLLYFPFGLSDCCFISCYTIHSTAFCR